MLQQTNPDDYVIATGETQSVREFLDKAFQHIGIDNYEDFFIIDEKFYRPSEVEYLKGIPTKAEENLGWERKVSFDDLVKRMQVRDRDDNKCQFPGCSSKSKLEVHHIKKWASHPSMRYDVTNGITLCKKCHNMVKNNEEVYESLFYKLLEWKATKKRDEDV